MEVLLIESQKIKRTVPSTTVAELNSFMKCFGSCDFLRWNYPVKLQKIHMRTDARNLVSTARTTHLLEQKETIHMISMLRSLFRKYP